jgi:potassium-transporting ATPase potassium-binding subunit
MTGAAWIQLAVIVLAVAAVAPLLGRYLAAVHSPGRSPGDRVFLPVERLVYRLIRVDPASSQRWQAYALSVVAFGTVSVWWLFLMLRFQSVLPFNPPDAPAVEPVLAFNVATSFVTGTNWQSYAGETTMSHLSQMAGLVVAQFTAAAVGMSVALAVVRGLVHRRGWNGDAGSEEPFGNFWVDVVRNTVRVLLPIAILAAIVMVSQGAVQNLQGNSTVETITGAGQVIPGGPVATQEVLKTLGTNGGGLYNAGSAHPLANPNGLTNAFELLLSLAIPFAFPFMYGRLIGHRRQGYTIVAVMAVLWVAPMVVAGVVESNGNPRADAVAVSRETTAEQPGGNMEGKESRFGPAASAQTTIGTMGTSAGITNSALDSYMPVGGASALGPILLGEISPGGVGSGLYGMLIYILLAVFIGGLLVGRTPEFLGKKVLGTQVKLIALYVLVLPLVILAGTAGSVLLSTAKASALNPGAHGFTEIFYAYTSAANGNGSAFAGLNSNTDWYNTTLGLVMLAGRFLPMVVALAIGGSLSKSRVFARSYATMPTSGPTFAVFLLSVVLILRGLTYLPALALGPAADQLGL